MVRESTGLDAAQARILDGKLAKRLAGLTPRKAADLARYWTIRIDAEAAFERAKANRADRFVSLFPDTDGVAVLQVRGPAEGLKAAHGALQQAANAAKAAGDSRTPGQVKCDEFVQRVTGLKKSTEVSVEIGLVMTVGNLLGADENPVHLTGFGPIPARLADQIIRSGAQAWIRRLYTDPVDGSLTDCDQKRRRFAGKLATLITRRDHRCRQPGCDSPIKHLDHIIAFHTGGPTTRDNAQGLCVRSHTLKHLPGWTLVNRDGTVIWQTPTGHQYLSQRRPVLEYHYQGTGHLRQ